MASTNDRGRNRRRAACMPGTHTPHNPQNAVPHRGRRVPASGYPAPEADEETPGCARWAEVFAVADAFLKHQGHSAEECRRIIAEAWAEERRRRLLPGGRLLRAAGLVPVR